MCDNNCKFIEKCIGVAMLILSIASLAFAIYVNAHWWIDWTSFLMATGAFLAVLVWSFSTHVVCLMLADFIGKPLIRFESAPFAFIHPIFTAGLSVPLWYYYALTPGYTGFWPWIMLMVCTVVPLTIIGVSEYFLRLAVAKDTAIEKSERDARKAERDAIKEKWAQYILGDGEAEFKERVVQFIEKFNIHFAQQCCMRMIPKSVIRWQIVDYEFVEHASSSTVPHPSYVNIETEFCVNNDIVKAEVSLSIAGYAHLGWNGVENGEKIATWEELIPVIEEKMKG